MSLLTTTALFASILLLAKNKNETTTINTPNPISMGTGRARALRGYEDNRYSTANPKTKYKGYWLINNNGQYAIPFIPTNYNKKALEKTLELFNIKGNTKMDFDFGLTSVPPKSRTGKPGAPDVALDTTTSRTTPNYGGWGWISCGQNSGGATCPRDGKVKGKAKLCYSGDVAGVRTQCTTGGCNPQMIFYNDTINKVLRKKFGYNKKSHQRIAFDIEGISDDYDLGKRVFPGIKKAFGKNFETTEIWFVISPGGPAGKVLNNQKSKNATKQFMEDLGNIMKAHKNVLINFMMYAIGNDTAQGSCQKKDKTRSCKQGDHAPDKCYMEEGTDIILTKSTCGDLTVKGPMAKVTVHQLVKKAKNSIKTNKIPSAQVGYSFSLLTHENGKISDCTKKQIGILNKELSLNTAKGVWLWAKNMKVG